MKFRLFLWICITPVLLKAQTDLRIGQWFNQIPYNSGNKITQSDEAVYYATDLAILRIQKSDLSTSKISTIEGLSGSRINAIYYHQEAKALIVAYSDGLIDLMDEDGTSAIPFIKIYNNLPISKNINSITKRNNNSVFINADFGLLSLNLNSKLIEFTIFTDNLKINNTLLYNNAYYSATSKGIYVFDLSQGSLIEDFANWKIMNLSNGLNPNESYKQVLIHSNELFVLERDELFKLNNGNFDLIRRIQDFSFVHGYGEGKDLILSMKYDFNEETKLVILRSTNDWLDIGGDCVINNLESLQEPSGRTWLADKRSGFRYFEDFLNPCAQINIPGPYNINVFDIKSHSDGIYVSSGGWDETFTYLYRTDGVFTYKDKSWDYINSLNNSFFKTNNIQDILRSEESKDHSKLFYASFQQGLIQFDRATAEYKLFNHLNTNNILGSAVGDPSRVRITGLDFDPKQEVLWIADYLAAKPVVSLDKTGNFKSYRLPGNTPTNIINITVDNNGYKWLVFRDGLGVFDEGDPNNPNDDRIAILNSSNTNITTNIIYNVTVDIEGDVWVGTAAGPVIFECGSSIFDGTCKGTRRKVDQNGIIGYLLESEEVLSLAVDGANRKWIGTRNGLYVQSPTGEFQIEYFNTENSPLLSNNIFSLAINDVTGEVWIGTDRGIQVYRSNATSAKDNFSEVPLVFPNPVTSSYQGDVAIKGLARDARVKITDLSGRLVYETFANGGQAIWNRKDYLGNEVSSGIYLIFANTVKDFDTSEGVVTKLVLTR